MSSNFTMVYYHVPADGDDQHTPNAFGVSKDIEQIRVSDLRKNFPLEGEYIFRFKFKNDGKVLWLDIPEQAKSIPRYNDCIYIKAVKIPEAVKQQDFQKLNNIMRILTGDDTGLVKLWNVEKQDVIMKFGEQHIENSISDILFFNDSETQVLSCSKNTTLNLYELNYQKKESELIQSILVDETKKNEIKGLHKFNGRQEILFTYENNQTFKLNFNSNEQYFEDIVKVYNPENQKGVETTILNDNQNKLLVLSKGVNPQLIDIEKQSQIWKAKNVKNDWLDLQVPIWDVDGYFFNNDNNIYTINAYQKIRIYDLNKKNSQPISDFEVDHKKLNEKSPFVGLQMSHCKNYMYVYNKAGSVFKFDTRKDYQLVGKLKGANGSIRDVSMHPTLPYLATVGLDRYIRVYNEDCKLVGKQNLGQRLNTCIFSKQQISDEEEFEEMADEKYHQNYKEDNKKTQQDHRENKKKFKDMKKHTIKLDYLKPKEEKLKALKKVLKKKEEQEKQIQQEQKEQYLESRKEAYQKEQKEKKDKQNENDSEENLEMDSDENPFNDSEDLGLDDENKNNSQEDFSEDDDDEDEEENDEIIDGLNDEEFDSSEGEMEEEEENDLDLDEEQEEDSVEQQAQQKQQKQNTQKKQQVQKKQSNGNGKNSQKNKQQNGNKNKQQKVTKNIKKRK